MPQTLQDLLAALTSALDAEGADELGRAVDGLIGHLAAHPDDRAALDAEDTLKTMRRHRAFAGLGRLADGLRTLGLAETTARRFQAQALIDTGLPIAALDVLAGLLAVAPKGSYDRAQALGLSGRAWKDIFAASIEAGAPNSRALDAALDFYGTGFAESGTTDVWTGENLLALLALAARAGVVANDPPDAAAIRTALKTGIEAKPIGARGYWDWASLAAVHVADRAWDAAYMALNCAFSAKHADAFALAGTLRQFTEVFGLGQSDDEAEAAIVLALQAQLADTTGGTVEIAAEDAARVRDVSDAAYEKIFGPNPPRSRDWMLRFLDIGRSVAQIRRRTGGGQGTAFVVRGGDFHAPLGDEKLLLTNDHVVSPDPNAYPTNPALRAETAAFAFETEGTPPVDVAEIVWSSPGNRHDASLLRPMTPIADAVPVLSLTEAVPLPNLAAPPGVYVVGHPGGGGLAFSLQNNALEDHDCDPTSDDVPRRIHYQTPTEPGSSGSPALDEDLLVIGLHHMGGKHMPKLNGQLGTYAANEAIWVRSIQRAAAKDLAAGRDRSRWT